MTDTTILVVDDELQIRRVLRAILCANDYFILEAKNGQEAIGMALTENPDLILLDVNMPHMNGFEVCSRIRMGFEGPIIMLTVRNSEQDKIVALDSGADDYVVKPFAVGELLARIRAALRRFRPNELVPEIDTPALSVNLEKRMMLVNRKRGRLTPREFDLFRKLKTRRALFQ
jgi:two-component system KDP operon response regulator KdpE